MTDALGPIDLAVSYIAQATKGAQTIAALFKGLTATKQSIQKFTQLFKREKRNTVHSIDLKDLIQLKAASLCEIKQVNGVLAPIMDFKGEEASDYKDASNLIKSNLSSVLLKSPENEFIAINSKEWLVYGCSLQSTTNDSIQILSLIDTEEANSLPVLVTNKFYERRLKSSELQYGINSFVSGILIPLSNSFLNLAIGNAKVNSLKISGYENVLIPDEDLINQLDTDFSFKPNIFFNTERCFFLGYIWAVYINIRTSEIVPIYEYGNLGDKQSFLILSEKLIHQIEFFKKRIWNEHNRTPEQRMYKLLISYNDNLSERIRSYFQEDDFFDNREEILNISREEIISNLF